MSSVVWMTEPAREKLLDHLGSKRLKSEFDPVVATSGRELLELTRSREAVVFLDGPSLQQLGQMSHVALPSRVVVVTSEPLGASVRWLRPYPWVNHVLSASLLEQPLAGDHLENVLRAAFSARAPRLLDWLGESVAGRRVKLTHASKRAARIERMSEFFTEKGVGPRTLHQLNDAAEELLTNAFYDAPVSAGAIKKPVPRTHDIALPKDSACDLAYGCRDDLAIVRVRDPFGSLSRRRLVEVLERCASTAANVEVDETMGGAGLGMWRIFSAASFVAISVVKNRYTEILVGIAKKTAAGVRPFAFHLFFRDGDKRSFWELFKDDTTNVAGINKSVMLVAKPDGE